MIASVRTMALMAPRACQTLPARPILLAESGGRLPVVTVGTEPFFNLGNSSLQKHFQHGPWLIKSILWATNVRTSRAVVQSDFAKAGSPNPL